MITAPWKVVHLDISQEIPDILPDSVYNGIYLVCWWHNFPLGHLVISHAQLPLFSAQLSNQIIQSITPTVESHLLSKEKNTRQEFLDWNTFLTLKNPLETYQNFLAFSTDSNDSLPTISVIICTRDRPGQLEQCLQSLQNLAVAPQEIIVVDNAPQTSATYQVVTKIPNIHYIKEPRPGLSIARNTGIRHATSDLIAFTDDDVRVHSDWIIRLQKTFRNPQIMAVTGLMIPGELESESQVIFEMNHNSLQGEYQAKIFDHSFFSRYQSFGVPVWRIGAGANMAFRQQIFEKVGYFDERLGAGASGCSEDSEMWYRILAEGEICVYEPTAVVFHYHRREMTDLHQQMYQYMRGHVMALLIQYTRYRHGGNLYRAFYDLPKYYLGLLISGLFSGFGLKQKTWIAEVLGCLAGIGFYLRYR